MDGPIAKSFGTFVWRYLEYIPVDSYENPITPGPPNLTISPHRFQAENDASVDRLQRIPSYSVAGLGPSTLRLQRVFLEINEQIRIVTFELGNSF